MPNWLICILIFIAGYLFPYVVSILDLGIQHITNLHTLNANKIQSEINKLSGETDVLEPCIGFRVDHSEEQEEYEE